MSQQEIKGGAEPLRLLSDIAAGAGSMVSSTTPTANWPTGVHPFTVRVRNASGSVEEKMLISARAGTGFTILTRGYDGTLDIGHTAGEAIEHVASAAVVQEANNHVNDTALDNHTQYLNAARHDVSPRHVFGGAFPNPATPAPIGTAAATGSGAGPARDDHVHTLPDGIVVSGKLGTGAVVAGNLANGSIDLASRLVAGVVDATAILDGTVTATELAASVAGNGLSGGAGTALAVNVDGSTVEINADTVRVKDAGITSAKIAAGFALVPTTMSVWTPVVRQTGAMTVSVQTGEYQQMGKLVTAVAHVTITGGSASAGTQIDVTLPINHHYGQTLPAGGCAYISAGGAHYLGITRTFQSDATRIALDFSTLAPSITLTTNDVLEILCSYFVA